MVCTVTNFPQCYSFASKEPEFATRTLHCTSMLPNCQSQRSMFLFCKMFARFTLSFGLLIRLHTTHAHIIEFTRLKNKRPFRFMISLVESLVSLQFSYGFRMGSMCVCGSVFVRCFSVPNSVNSVCMDHVAILVCPHGNEFDGIVFEIEMNVFM